MPETEIAAFFEACPLAAIILDADDLVLLANPAARSIWEAEGEIVGLPVAHFLPEWPLAAGSTASFFHQAGKPVPCRLHVVIWPGRFGLVTAVLIDAVGEEAVTHSTVREANLRLRYVIEMLPQAMCVFDAQDRYVLWNQKYADLYVDVADHLAPGMPFEEILKISLASGRMPEVVLDNDAWLKERMAKFRRPVSQEEQRLQDGRWLRHDDHRTPDGGAIGMRVDITELKQREEWLRQLFEANPMPMLLCDADTLDILEANLAALDFYGFEPSVLMGKTACDMHAAGDALTFARKLRNLDGDCEARTVWRQFTAAGKEHHVLIYVRFLKEGSNRRLLLTIADVSERVFAENEANRLANHDVLTDLPNRMHFYKALRGALSSAEHDELAVFCLDLDGFKPVNDTFGHAAGDQVLKLVAERLRLAVDGHMVARLGGDEFAILMKLRVDDPVAVAMRCLAAFDEPFLIKGLAIRLGVSIGIAVASGDEQDGDNLVQAADRALYRAKASGRNTWHMAGDEQSDLAMSK